MSQGGKRKGAGRPKGARNKKTAEQVAAIIDSGLAPLDYLLSVMRDEGLDRAARVDAAHKAAPYVHPKLTSVDHKSEDGSMTPQSPVAVYQLPDNGRN